MFDFVVEKLLNLFDEDNKVELSQDEKDVIQEKDARYLR